MALNSIYDFVWDDKWWFPNKIFGKHYGWKDLENQPGSEDYYPQVGDLQWGILLGAGLVILRFILERFLIAPLGYKLGIEQKRFPYITPNPLLESVYKQRHEPNYEVLSKQTDWTVKQIAVWFRKRKKRDATPKIKKFCDSGWHFMFYTTSFIYGLCLLWNKPWFGKTMECWVGWPKQHVSNDIYWYYMIELGFYCSLIFTLLSDHKRSDFGQMIVHHIATIVLIYFSWISNFVRVGTLVLLVHDASDPWLEIAKIGIYLKWKTFTDVSFAIFVLIWTVARHFILPFVSQIPEVIRKKMLIF
ncbi:ceramide synthase 5-like isoform X3 [Mercenaria mercenaria]|uniref:ceramide synthase 5-like isoform X3 n=1 Tax=Mercenaria mercenaria TaxID=6596 RepID=UPI00234FAD55|nr:ceramide synthase 5-like isoform X3 [Mercenaria mercenaria]